MQDSVHEYKTKRGLLSLLLLLAQDSKLCRSLCYFWFPHPYYQKSKNMQTCGKNTRNTESSHAEQGKKNKRAERWIYGLRGGLSWTTMSLLKHDWNWQAIRSRSDAPSNLKQLVPSALRLWAGQFCTTTRETRRRRRRPGRSIAINGGTKWQQGSTQPEAVSSEAKSIGRTNSCNRLQPDTSDFYISSHIREQAVVGVGHNKQIMTFIIYFHCCFHLNRLYSWLTESFLRLTHRKFYFNSLI